MIIADLDFNRFFENDEILRIYDTKRHYQDLIQLDTPLGESDETPSPLDALLNSTACSVVSVSRARTCG
jgi:uncharacterized OsmC-like protein